MEELLINLGYFLASVLYEGISQYLMSGSN